MIIPADKEAVSTAKNTERPGYAGQAGMYPKTLRENLIFRSEVLTKCETDPVFLGAIQELTKRDVLFFFNTWLWAEDPFADKGERHGIPKIRMRPVITYGFQDEFIVSLKEAIDRGEDILADKSRDMLATYMVLGVFLHGWLNNGHKYVITSWKEDEIDGKEDTSTHFGKLRLFLRRLPYFLLPNGWDWRRNSSYMKLQNPENGGTITGSAASASLASGRREDAIFMDELSKWEKYQREGWISASDSTKCKVGVWTPRGSGNFAAELMRGDEVQKKHHLLWHLHPEKRYTSKEHLEVVKKGGVRDKTGGYVVQVKEGGPSGCYLDQHGKIRSEWYDEECKKRTKEDIAENLDCNYLTSGQPYFDTLICEENLRLMSKEPKLVGNLLWKVAPVFDSKSGDCINQDQLVVELVENFNGRVKVWELPENGYEYGYSISADVAEGLEQGDYSSASVLRRFGDKPEFVATLHGHLKIFEYAEELAKLGVYFNRAYIAVERNKDGSAVILQLLKLYRWLWHKDVITKGYPQMTDKIGFETANRHVKHSVCGELQKAISLREFVDPDTGFWNETLTFVNNNGALEAQGKSQGQKCFDDRVMDRAINLWASMRMPSPVLKREKVKRIGWRKDWDEEPKGRLVRFAV